MDKMTCLSISHCCTKTVIYSALVMCGWINQALATCTKVPVPITVNVTGSYIDTSSKPVGTPINSGWVTATETNYAICRILTSDSMLSSFTAARGQAGSQIVIVDGQEHQVLQTTHPGIGYIVEAANNPSYPGANPGWSRWAIGAVGTRDVGDGIRPDTNRDVNFGYRVRVMLIKTGPVATGSVPNVVIGRGGQGDRRNNYTAFVNNITLSGGLTVRASSCTTAATRLDIVLSDVYVNELSGAVGSTSKERAENIALNCNPQTQISLLLEGVQNADTSAAGVLQLTNAGGQGVADGVGIQILMNNTPLALNTQTSVRTSAGGAENIEIRARYYKTKSAITAGDANAIGTLNIVYE